MGPLAQLFGYLYDQNRENRVNALRGKLSAGDDMGPIYLDQRPSAEDSQLPYKLRDFERRPGIKGSRNFRDPEQMGPSPPLSSPFAAVLGKR